jgi:uncharacterized protein YeaO (DUF488 family)
MGKVERIYGLSWLESSNILILMAILLKCAHEAALREDGARVLVDRREPRGVAKESLELRSWLPMLGPSDPLERWLMDRPSQWPVFRRRYLAELCDQKAVDALVELEAIATSEQSITLLTAAQDPEHSHAAVLRDLLEGVKKPPATSGPAWAIAGGRIRARRNR